MTEFDHKSEEKKTGYFFVGVLAVMVLMAILLWVIKHSVYM